MRLTFDVDLPDQDLKVGTADLRGRSMVGYEGRQYKRFFPLILCLETLTKINEWQINRRSMEGYTIPRLYDSGVVYRMESPGVEDWDDIITIYKQGWGDCEDLACARAAELRCDGIAATPAIRFKQINAKNGPLTLVHVLVLHPSGEVEDPSKILGMRGEY